MRCSHRRIGLAVVVLVFQAFLATADDPVPPLTGPQDPPDPPSLPAAHKSWFQRHFVRPTWDEALQECRTPQDICRIVARCVADRVETIDRWYPAQETWRRGRGDCEDFAICVQELCHQLGMETAIRLYYPTDLGEGHAVVVGRTYGRLWMSSMGSYEEVASEDDVARKVARMIGCRPEKMWSRSLAHADVEHLLARTHGLEVGQRGRTTGMHGE